MNRVLVIGGAGFIGSHTVDALLKKGHEVRVFDNLDPQVHGRNRVEPEYLTADAEFMLEDVRDLETLRKAVSGVNIILHLAAAVGVSQSMYQIRKYVEVNTLGTANLLEILANERHSVRKLIVASSMSVYGEGSYYCAACGEVYPKLRPVTQLEAREWEMRCPNCGNPASPLPTAEDKPLFPASIYAISKRDQEEMVLCFGQAYGIPTVVLRYFNVYGPRQALSNPYTGVAAIFCSRLLTRKSPVIYEDGLQSRDFIHVRDIVQANMLALENPEADYQIFNVGTGKPVTILELVAMLRAKLDREDIKPIILNKYREGDIRHCYADISEAIERLGFQVTIPLEQGVNDLMQWVKRQKTIDLFEFAAKELKQRRLLK